MLISCSSGSKRSNSQCYSDVYNYQKNFIAHNFLLHQVFLGKYLATFPRFCSSFVDLKYSLKFMATKSFTSSAVKILKESSIFGICKIMFIIRAKCLSD